MSAITGILHFHNHISALDLGQKLMKPLQHFPFDSLDTYYKDNTYLGCLAQWLMPEDINRKQCYFDYDKRLGITADITLDNRDELFNKLNIKHPDRSEMTDSELVLIAYLKWQEDTPLHLIGDFAFMIWDEYHQKLFGARDFSGSRTFYYHHNPDQFVFSTLLKPLLQMPFITQTLNDEWMAEFLAIPNMIDTQSAHSTVYRDVHALPPSHTITVLSSGKITLSQYLKIEAEEPQKFRNREDYMEAFQELYQTAVTSRLRTYKKVGAQLSGGLDSGSVVSFAAPHLKQQNKKLHTFSSIPIPGYEDWTPSYLVPDERKDIKQTVGFVGNINDEYCSFPDRNAVTEIDHWLQLMEMPYKFFENATWLRGIQEKASQKEIGLLLNGARGNFSISWGPAQYYFAELLKKWRFVKLFHEIKNYSRLIDAKQARVWNAVKERAYPRQPAQQRNEEYNIISPELAKRTNIYEKLRAQGFDVLNETPLTIHQLRSDHFQQMNVWNATGTSRTKLSLQYNVQTHDPTNDLRIIKFCLGVPLQHFFGNGMERGLIRRATKGYLPDTVRLNQLTRGIQGADTTQRMKQVWSLLLEEGHEMVRNPLIQPYLNQESIKQSLTNLQQNEGPPKNPFNDDFCMVMRSLIVYRFIRSVKGGEKDEKGMENSGIRST